MKNSIVLNFLKADAFYNGTIVNGTKLRLSKG